MPPVEFKHLVATLQASESTSTGAYVPCSHSDASGFISGGAYVHCIKIYSHARCE